MWEKGLSLPNCTTQLGEKIRQKGEEFGATTGRPRRCGWFDAVVVKHSIRINGIQGMTITKLDVLNDLDKIKVCVGYRLNGKVIRSCPVEPGNAESLRSLFTKNWMAGRRRSRGRRILSDLPPMHSGISGELKN